MSDPIKIDAMYDVPLWGKNVAEDGKEETVLMFPLTRYHNIIGRPKLIENVSEALPTDIALLKSTEIEVDDDLIYNRVGQIW